MSSEHSKFGSVSKFLVNKVSPNRHEKSFTVNRVKSKEYARERFAVMLRAAFRGETTSGVAKSASKILGVTPRQVTYLLNGESSPAFEHVVAVGTIIGIWKTMEIMTIGQTRETVAKWIGQA